MCYCFYGDFQVGGLLYSEWYFLSNNFYLIFCCSQNGKYYLVLLYLKFCFFFLIVLECYYLFYFEGFEIGFLDCKLLFVMLLKYSVIMSFLEVESFDVVGDVL